MRPIIGLTASKGHDSWGQPTSVVADAYVRAIVEAEGIPVIVPSELVSASRDELCSRLDGILFTGGGDIEPLHYGGGNHPSIEGIDRARDALELKLLERVIADGKPFLGICRGCQLINVGLGGTLYEDIRDGLPGALEHDQLGERKLSAVHEVRLEDGSLVSRISGTSVVAVNSHHHQGLKDLGRGLRAVGRTADGLIEAIELPAHPFGLAVQWHPEWLTSQTHARALFAALVEACARPAATHDKR